MLDVTKRDPPSSSATAQPRRFVRQPSIPSSRPRFDAGQPSVTTPHRVVKDVPRLMSQSGKPSRRLGLGQPGAVPQPGQPCPRRENRPSLSRLAIPMEIAGHVGNPERSGALSEHRRQPNFHLSDLVFHDPPPVQSGSHAQQSLQNCRGLSLRSHRISETLRPVGRTSFSAAREAPPHTIRDEGAKTAIAFLPTTRRTSP